ncbi:nicotinate mononucleotide adenylyltransferase, putative [Plasmodium relictum]|uniref:Nicotinate-nucleotide adenylyltransferase, putative n=1 Tax=Plasmodium relictum TaxID=85471 RepID=A0A1J1H830_PLARL|nr:nicotinate mononucleotide adenylyltransferase, putative [Plasmodium relictum]CRH01120.1 nicotinate mononucleotide adenylyltransferase, putative [Plasmodium relictum]
MNKNICIYGGSFDPITNAHEMVLTKICNLNWIDEIWVVISKCRNDKELTYFQHRYEMLSIIINNASEILKNKIFLKDLEYINKITPTYDLLKTQKEKYPNNTFYFCLGSDLLSDISLWDNSEKLILENYFIIIERGNFKIDKNILKQFPKYYLIEFKHLSEVNFISSSNIRKMLAKNNNPKELKKLINPLILDYIKKHNLYQCNVE